MDTDDMDDFFDYIDFVEDQMNKRLPKRYIRDFQNPIEFYSDEEFKHNYRFTKHTVTNIILPMVIEKLQVGNNRGLAIPPLVQLLICLRYFATGNFQDASSDFQGISQSTVSRIIKRVSTAVTEKLPQFIKFPETQNDQQNNIAHFQAIAGFPYVAGCINCFHIPISNPGESIAETFRNEKGSFSLKVQIIVGPNKKIMDIVRQPGSTHNSIIFEKSVAKIRFEQHQIKGVLLGDSSYTCTSYLLTPVSYPQTPSEIHYNQAHKATIDIVDEVFKFWRQCFPCLTQEIKTTMETTLTVICATAVLYNIALQDYNEQKNELNTIDDKDLHENVNNTASEFRQKFIYQNF